jgi:flagellin-like hook-associated protein FlgL
VNSLRVALSNNDQPGTAAAVASIQAAQDYLSLQSTFYGAVQNRVANSLDIAQKFQLQWKSSLSDERDTDVAAASTDLAQERLSQQSALQAEGSMPHSSLFDFLK